MSDVSRREFVKGVGLFAALATLGGIGAYNTYRAKNFDYIRYDERNDYFLCFYPSQIDGDEYGTLIIKCFHLKNGEKEYRLCNFDDQMILHISDSKITNIRFGSYSSIEDDFEVISEYYALSDYQTVGEQLIEKYGISERYSTEELYQVFLEAKNKYINEKSSKVTK